MSLLISTTELCDPTKNQITKPNTYAPNLTIHQISLNQFPNNRKTPLPALVLWKHIQWIKLIKKITEDKLHQSGYQQKLKYNLVNTKIHNKRNHKRNIIWFNSSFSRNVLTKIGKCFLNLLDKRFPQNHRFHIVSYSCTKNMKTVTNNHNKSILGINSSINYQLTIVKKACPLNVQCQIAKIVYQDTLSINQPKK